MAGEASPKRDGFPQLVRMAGLSRLSQATDDQTRNLIVVLLKMFPSAFGRHIADPPFLQLKKRLPDAHAQHIAYQ